MSQATIKWQPTVSQGEHLAVADEAPELFIMQMQRVFPGEWPIRLTVKDIDKLTGMAAVSTMIGNPYMTLLEHLKRYKKIEVWPEYGEDVGL